MTESVDETMDNANAAFDKLADARSAESDQQEQKAGGKFCRACNNSRYTKADTAAMHELTDVASSRSAHVCCPHYVQVMGACSHSHDSEAT